MARILVTGSAGLLGTNLSKLLLEREHDVIGLDNLRTGQIKNIRELEKKKNFRFIEHDVNLRYEFAVDAIVNLACPASPVHYQKDPIYTFQTNINGAMNALLLAEKLGVPVLQASTSEIYGDPLVHPQPETYWGNVNPIGIRSCYDEGKRGAETLFADFRRHRQVQTKIMRIFNTYGPEMAINDGRVVSNFITQALTDKPITMFGSGNQTRSFCYVSDLVEGMYSFLFSPEDLQGPINFGNPRENTMLELARTIIEITKSKSEILFEELPSDDPDRRKPDISVAKASLNWTPKISLEEGLEKTINSFRKRLL